jgi:hypothetical protein
VLKKMLHERERCIGASNQAIHLFTGVRDNRTARGDLVRAIVSTM